MASFTHPTLGLLGLIPVPARVPYRETLSWLTEVQTMYRGNESAIKSRISARQELSNDFDVQPTLAADTFNTVFGALVRRWAIPLWAMARSAGHLAADQTALDVDTRYSDFRVGDPVLILGGCGAWFVGYIDALTTDAITLEAGTHPAIRGAWAVPLRVGRLARGAQKSTSGYGADWSLTYAVDDNLAWSPDAPTQFYGNDIYLTPGLLTGENITAGLETESETFDYELGKVEVYSPWTHNRVARPYRMMGTTPAEAWAIREWLYRRAGRYRPFWLPTFENDVRLAQTGTLAGTVTVVEDSRIPFAQDRLNLAFGLRDGTWLPRRITADDSGGAGLRTFTLNAALNVPAANVVAISYMGLSRLDSDQVTLDWIGNGVCATTVPILEITP